MNPGPGLRARLAWGWPAKILLGVGGTAAFFAAYALVQRHHLGEAMLVPWTALDRALPFTPAAVHPYLSLALFMPLPQALLCSRDDLLRFHIALTALAVAGLGCFLLVPTAIDRAALEPGRGTVLAWLRTVDGCGNACPSLHAGFALFTAAVLWRIAARLRHPAGLRALAAGWCGLILIATLLVKQHTVIDLAGGMLLGAAAALWWRRGGEVR